MIYYEPDKDGWVLMAEQGSEFWVKDFKTTSGEQVIVYIDVYDDMTKVVWFGPGSVEQIVNNWDFEVAEISEENMILMAEYTESLGYPPAQPREGFYFNPWKIVEGKARSKFQDVEEILSKFSALSGFPSVPGIFYEEMEK